MKNILLVEDDGIIGLNEKLMLEKEGYKVIHCFSGEKAIEIVKELKNSNFFIDIILMDIDLGKGLDGVQTAEEILKENDIPIIFISSHNEKDIIEKTERVNSYGYIVKNSSEIVIFTIIKLAFKLFNANKKIQNSMKELIVKEKLLENIFNSISDIIAIFNVNLELIKVNKKDFFDFYNEEKTKEILMNILENKNSYRYEECIENRDLEFLFYPIFNGNNNIINFVQTIKDITKKKRSIFL